MRIAFIIRKISGTTGGRRALYEVSSRLLKLGHEVRIFTNKLDEKDSFKELLALPIEVVPCRESVIGHLTALMLSLEAVKTGKAAAQWRPDVVVVEGLPSWFPPYFYGIDDSAGAVFLHVPPERSWFPPATNLLRKIYNLPLKRWEKVSLRKLKVFIANSHYTARSFQELDLMNSIPVEVAYLGVDHSRIYPTWEDEGFVLCLSRIDPRKNLELAIQAMTHVKADAPLMMVGTMEQAYSEYREKLSYLVQELNLVGRVKLQIVSGDVDVIPLIQKCSVFLAPGLRETFGLAPLEAMACGKPVVASKAGALPEIIGDRGFLLEPEPEEWGQTIDSLLQDPGLRKKLGERAFERSRLFTWDRHAERLLEIFSKIT